MSRGNLIGLVVVVVLVAAVGIPSSVEAQPKSVTLELKEGKAKVESQLTKEDALDVKGRKLSYSKAYAVAFEAGTYRIDAISKAFDTYLRLEDPSGTHVAADDDGGDGSNARIVYRVAKAGTYRIIVTSFDPGRVGAFTLAVTGVGASKGKNHLVLDNNGRVSVDASLTKEDELDPVRKTPCKVYLVDMDADAAYRIDHVSRAFDAYLRLEDPDGKQVAADDDGGEGTNARITYRPTKAGTYRVIPTTLNAERIGAFNLSIVRSGVAKQGRLVLKDGRVSIDSELTKDDAKDTVKNAPCKIFLVELEADKTYRIDHVSNAFDAYLRLEDDAGKQLAQDDDGGGNLNARIVYRPTKTATYRVIPTTLSADRVGAFTLSIVGPDVPKQGDKLVLKNGKAEVDGTLTRDDPFDRVRDKSRCQTFKIDMEANASYRIDLMSRAFDAYLRLEDPDGKQVASDDDGGDGTNARIIYRPTTAGTYRIIATQLNDTSVGAYTLIVTQSGGGGRRLTLDKGRGSVDAELTKDDERDVVRKTPCKVYLVDMEAGQTYRIDHVSKQFDAYLRLEDPDGRALASDDDGGDGTNSRLVYRAQQNGAYRVIPTSLNGQTGAFTLTVAKLEAARPINVAMKDGKLSVDAALTRDDPKDYTRIGNPAMKLYAVELEAGRAYQVDLMSKAFDAFLRLDGTDGKTLAVDDDGGEGLNSRITFRCYKTGTYQVAATTRGNSLGDFTLTIQQGGRIAELVLKDSQAKVESVLSKEDPRDYGSTTVVSSRAYAVKMEAGETYQIDMSSRRFDSYLRLQGPDGKTVAENDDVNADSLDARIEYRCTTSGTYYVIAKPAFFTTKFGAFTLSVQQRR